MKINLWVCDLESFQEKWTPVFRPKTRQIKGSSSSKIIRIKNTTNTINQHKSLYFPFDRIYSYTYNGYSFIDSQMIQPEVVVRWLSTSFVVIIFMLLISPAASAGEREVLPGPVMAQVERVIDGDTLEVRAKIWVGQEIRVLVRLSGVDTPELSGHCDSERSLAHRARSFVVREINGGMISLTNIRQGKYAGRVIADIVTAAGDSLGDLLLSSGLARPYRKRRYERWCCEDGSCSFSQYSNLNRY